MKILTLLSLVVFASCSPSEVLSKDLVKYLVERNGIKYLVNSRTPFTGEGTRYYKNGQLMVKGNFKDGKREGVFVNFDKGGQLEGTGNYKDGKLDGLYENYDGDRLESKENYKDGKLVSLEAYHSNGQLMAKVNYKDAKLDGLYEWFHVNGQLKATGNYKDGKLDGLYESYQRNGQLEAKVNKENVPLDWGPSDLNEYLLDRKWRGMFLVVDWGEWQGR